MSTDAPLRSEATPPSAVRRQRGRVGDLVAGRVSTLQHLYRSNTSTGVGQLAALRRASTAEPGSDPRVWELTLAGLDVPAGTPDAATPEEFAVHAAMTLYAVHQQSKSESMHRAGFGLGHAVRLLGREVGNEQAVRRRFDALATASTFVERMDHARGLVRQLRSASIPLDYGQLADDLVALQHPTTATGVRLRWGRDYHRVRPDAAPTQATDSTDSEENA